MKNINALHNVVLITGMVGLFVLAGLFDFVINLLTEQNSQLGTLDLELVWLFPLLQFVLALAACVLIWFMAARKNFSRWVSMVFLVVGLVMLIANPIIYMSNFPESLFVIVLLLSPGSLLFEASGLVAALGLLSIFARNSSESDSMPFLPDDDTQPDLHTDES